MQNKNLGLYIMVIFCKYMRSHLSSFKIWLLLVKCSFFFCEKSVYFWGGLLFLSSLQWRSVKSPTFHPSRKTTTVNKWAEMVLNLIRNPTDPICRLCFFSVFWSGGWSDSVCCSLLRDEENSQFLLSVLGEKKYVYVHYGGKPLSWRPPAVGRLSDVGITETRKCGEGLAEMRTT